MNAEKEILIWWLNNKGYFTLSSINAGRNKEIDVIAVKLENGIKEIKQYEVMVSISQTVADDPTSKNINDIIKKKFNDKLIQKKVNSVIKEHIGSYENYKRTIVIGALPKSGSKKIVSKFKDNQIGVVKFENILFDVLKNISGMNFNNPVIRTLQIFKYLLLSNPIKLAKISHESMIMNTTDQGNFIKALLANEDSQASITKKISEADLIRILTNSSLKEPKRLAKILEENVLSKRSRTTFMNELLKSESIKEKIQTEFKPKGQKSLSRFLN